MTQLIIESMPSGAEVTIDGQTIGTTPMTHTIDETVGLTEFRAECLSGGNVVCSWDILKTRLEDLSVSQIWWDLTRDERYSIAEMAIKNELFYYVGVGRSGDANCVGGIGDYTSTGCVQNAVIRYMKFSGLAQLIDISTKNTDACYFKRYRSDESETCYRHQPYNLPCNIVDCHEHFTGPGFGHTMCAIQIKEGHDSIDNWIVFQYSSFDIKPGTGQMPLDKRVCMFAPTILHCRGSSEGEYVAEFDV